MSRRYKDFAVTGTANDTEWAAKLTSSEAEPKKLLGLLLHVSGYAGNKIILDFELKRLATLYDYHFNTEADLGAANFPYSTSKLHFIELEKDIPLGHSVQVGLACGATKKNLFGAYVYDTPD